MDIKEEDHCVICFEEDISLIKFYKCQHQCICLECYLKVENKKNFTCPLCRTIVARTDGYNRSLTLRKLYPMSDEYYGFLKMYLGAVKTNRLKNTCKILYDSYKNLEIKYKLKKCKLNIDQCENLLRLVGDYEVLRQIIVCMCIEPWKIDVKLGNSGVCHYGNLGEEPKDLIKMIHILESNYKTLITKKILASKYIGK